jgi:hypothetical protein
MQYWCGEMMPQQASACDAMWTAVRPPLPPDASVPGSELTDIDSEMLRLLEEVSVQLPPFSAVECRNRARKFP